MTNLSDFLKCEKVRCLSNLYDHIGQGKAYKLIGFRVLIIDEAGDYRAYPIEDFEPVIETAIQATDSLDDTPMGTRTVSKFKVGDLVYCKNNPKILKVVQVGELIKVYHQSSHYDPANLTLATPESYEMLCKLFPNIKFEAPPKELTGSDLCRAMLDKGWKYVPCYVSNNSSDEFAIKAGLSELIIATDADRTKEFVGDDVWTYAVPFDPKTGNILTSEVLDDQ